MPANLQKLEIRKVVKSDCLEVIDKIEKITNDPNQFCLSYIDLNSLTINETPAWDNFTRQFAHEEYKELFMAWIYSVFYAKNKGRQLLWIYGKGKSGKSTIGKLIFTEFATINPSLASTIESKFEKDKYSFASYKNSRFIVIGDCAQRGILYREEIKNITGADIVSIRHMNQEKKAMEIYAKILVTSNKHPFVNIENDHELTRILYVALDDAKCNEAFKDWTSKYQFAEWEHMLKNEFWHFVAKCEHFYFKHLSGDHHNFTMPSIMLDSLQRESQMYSKNEMITFWEHNIIEKKGNKLSIEKIQERYAKFMELKEMTKFMKSFLFTHIKSLLIPLEPLGIGNAYYINDYDIKPGKMITISTLIDETLQKDIDKV